MLKIEISIPWFEHILPEVIHAHKHIAGSTARQGIAWIFKIINQLLAFLPNPSIIDISRPWIEAHTGSTEDHRGMTWIKIEMWKVSRLPEQPQRAGGCRAGQTVPERILDRHSGLCSAFIAEKSIHRFPHGPSHWNTLNYSDLLASTCANILPLREEREGDWTHRREWGNNYRRLGCDVF